MSYWSTRIAKTQEALYNKSQQAHNAQLRRYYRQAIQDTIDNISGLYDKITSTSGTVQIVNAGFILTENAGRK